MDRFPGHYVEDLYVLGRGNGQELDAELLQSTCWKVVSYLENCHLTLIMVDISKIAV